jgi:hypothetical protein
MPPKRTIQPQINTVWAKSLEGLSMKVPGYWWDGCKKSYKLHDGGVFPLEPISLNARLSFERAAEVPRDSPKFFKILKIEYKIIPSS